MNNILVFALRNYTESHKVKNEISKIVKLKTGLSFPEYMNRKKIEYAKELLLGSDDTVENIAKKSGFSYSCDNEEGVQ